MSPDANDGVWVIVPAFNEARAITPVVAELVDAGFQVLVVDDASLDDTATLARVAGAQALRHPINLGQGAALQTGISYALQQGARIIVTFDADGQHRVGDIAALITALASADAEFALGSRFLGSVQNAPGLRMAVLRLATWFTRATTGLKITDTHNGLRAMTRRGAQAIRLRQNRMAHASELLDQIARSGLTYVEVPVTVTYSAYSLAKGQRLRDAVSIVLDLIARRLQR